VGRVDSASLSHLDEWEEVVQLPVHPTNPVPRYLFNPGSVGQPRNGCTAAFYGIVELEGLKLTLQIRNVAYDVATTQRKLRDRGYPEALAERLGRGR
jgi:diadenosine tetraphosphatase ApaH/serine/threonine PP2A family protein phosphatase